MKTSETSGFPEPAPVRRLESIQILRGLAAMLVVYNHAGLYLALPLEYNLGPSRLVPSLAAAKMGAIGVDLFFVISGFVMALSAPRFTGPAGAGLFLAQRYVRIAPLFYLACLVMLADLLRAGVPIETSSVLNSITFVPIFDDEVYSWPLHYLGWTLAFEFVFYLIVATLIACGKGRAALVVAAVVLIPFLGLMLKPALIAAQMATNPILWEFALGAVLCLLYERRWLDRLRRHLVLGASLATAALVLALWLWPEQLVSVGEGTVSGDLSAARALVWGLPAALFFAAVVTMDAGDSFAARLLKLLGDASYSIYLTHLFVVMIMKPVLERVKFDPDLVVIVTLCSSAAVGIVVYRWVESPLLKSGRRAIKQWTGRRSRVPA